MSEERRRYVTAVSFVRALSARLLNENKKTGRNITRMRKEIAFDRVLARVSAAAPDAWLLKGGVALEYRLGAARVTKDLDLSFRDETQIHDTVRALQHVEIEDFFKVHILSEPSGPIIDGISAYRWKLEVRLNDRQFEHLILDIGVADPFFGEPEIVRGQPLLEFAGIESASVPAIPVEQHIAEKVHAYTRAYGVSNTRVKDLVDLALLSSFGEIDGATLRTTLDGVFRARASHELPTSFPLPPSSWTVPYRKLTETLDDLSPQLIDGHKIVAEFLDPVLVDRYAVQTLQWNPSSRSWGAQLERTADREVELDRAPTQDRGLER